MLLGDSSGGSNMFFPEKTLSFGEHCPKRVPIERRTAEISAKKYVFYRLMPRNVYMTSIWSSKFKLSLQSKFEFFLVKNYLSMGVFANFAVTLRNMCRPDF